MRHSIISVILLVLIHGCSTPNLTDESKYVSYVFRFPSPNGKQALYRYWVKYPDAHYGHTRFSILPASAKFKPSSDFFFFNDTLYGFAIVRWSGDTIKSLCITSSEQPSGNSLPYKKEIAKLKNGFWEQDFYNANSFHNTQIEYFDSIIYSKETVRFVQKSTSLSKFKELNIVAQKGQITVPLGDSIIRVSRLEALTTIDGKFNAGDTVRKPPLVSLSDYLLRPRKKIDWKRLKSFGVFVEQPYKH